MNRRLPPAPTNTALARFVRRLIDCLPWVAIAQRKAAQREMHRALAELSFQLERNIALHRDMKKMMVNIPLPRFEASAHSEKSLHSMRQDIFTKVSFESLGIATTMDMRCLRLIEVQDYTKAILREHAHEIAHTLADDLAKVILDQTMRKYGVQA
jgi:hypothetical protein